MASHDQDQATQKQNQKQTQLVKKITLMSSDGYLFEVEECVAMEFGTIKSYLEVHSDEVENIVVPLPAVSSAAFTRMITYCKKHVELRANSSPQEEIIEFDGGFVKDIEDRESLVELVVAADYLEVKELLELMNQTIADRIQNKSVEYVRWFFGIENDFTAEEEEKLRLENSWVFEGVDPN